MTLLASHVHVYRKILSNKCVLELRNPGSGSEWLEFQPKRSNGAWCRMLTFLFMVICHIHLIMQKWPYSTQYLMFLQLKSYKILEIRRNYLKITINSIKWCDLHTDPPLFFLEHVTQNRNWRFKKAYLLDGVLTVVWLAWHVLIENPTGRCYRTVWVGGGTCKVKRNRRCGNDKRCCTHDLALDPASR